MVTPYDMAQELSDRGVLKRHLAREYRQPDPLQAILTDGKFSVIEHSKGQTRDLKIDSSNRCRRYILGYTGTEKYILLSCILDACMSNAVTK